MRTTQDAAHRRRPAAVHVPAGPHAPAGLHAPASLTLSLIALAALAALAGCSSGGAASSSAQAGEAAPQVAVASPSAAGFGANAEGAAAPAATAANGTASAAAGTGGSAQAASSTRLAPADQQLVYTAQLTVRASGVSAAVTRATSIVTGAGGYISAENASSDPGDPHQATATIEVKIPVAAYARTLVQLSADLGTQLALRQQAQDVTQQVADVTSRVASDEAAIAQLRALLRHAGSVPDLLTVQDQINSEESDLESLQAEQNALNHETSYATLTLTILGPQATAVVKHVKPKPAPGFANGLSGGWRAFRTAVSWLLAIIGAVAPFAAVAAALGYLAYWIRRRLAHR
jgi:Domain of unknown function (DUF4349)